MPGPEAKIETKACKYADELDILHRKVKYVGRRGASDRWFFPSHRPLFIIEFKKPGGEFQPGQEVEIGKLRARGYKVFVCDNVEEAKSLIRIHGIGAEK